MFEVVYMDRRELKCAYVGGCSNLPLAYDSLADNLMIVELALWTLLSSMILTNSRLSRLRSPKPD